MKSVGDTTQKMIAVIEDDVHIGDIIEESLHRRGIAPAARIRARRHSICWRIRKAGKSRI